MLALLWSVSRRGAALVAAALVPSVIAALAMPRRGAAWLAAACITAALTLSVSPVAAQTITISPTTLPNATTRVAYSQTLTATGGTAPYSFSVTAGALPAGITLFANGTLSGTTNTAGQYTFTVTATDANGNTGSQGYTLTVTAPPITLAPTALPNATTRIAYNQTLSASGGTAPYTFSVTAGALPAGITLFANGTLSGTTNTAGQYTFTVTATDANGNTGSQGYTLTVTAPPITLAPTTLPNATTRVAYSQTITATGGTAPYSFSVTAGALPAGITLFANGTLSGTTNTAGQYTFTVTATDANGNTGARSYTLAVNAPAITLAPTGLPNATTNVSYSQALSASGGTAPYSYAVTAGALPAGITLSQAGQLSGKATTAGSFTFTVTATDANGNTGARSYTLAVNAPAITLAPTGLPNATVGAPYSQTITASGGTAPYGYAVTAGALPAGITLSSGGVLSGSATTGGSFTFTVTATDANGNQGARAYTLTVATPTITVAPASLPDGNTNINYSQTITASGGTAPYSFSVTAGALPIGLTLAVNGTLSGKPTQAGSYTFTVTARDSSTGSGPYTGSRSYTVAITAPTITLAPATLPDATTNVSYSQTITASGGAGGYTYAVTAGALPAGITLSSGGVLSGRPTAAGQYTFTVTARDANGNTGSQGYTLTVTVATITLAPATLPNATVGASYSQTITASGGTAPYGYAVTAGALPAGITLSTSGTLSGTPTAGGSFSFTVTATDANGNAGSRTYALAVTAPTIAVAPATLPNGAVGTSYSQTLTASGGTAPYSYAVTAGALPAGLTLTAGGVLSGAPTTAGSYTFTVTASDSSTGSGPYTGSRGYTVTIAAATTSTALTSSPNPSMSGQAVTLTATVTSAGGTPTGTVTFTNGSTTLGTAALNNGVATLTVSTLPVGTSTLTASYGGTTSFGPSSGSTTQTVNAANTTTALTSSPNPSSFGQSVTFTATVTGQGPTGSVTFRDGGTVLGTASLANGTATFSTAALAVGAHTITATYEGDTRNSPSTSPALTQTVNAAATTTTLTSSRNPSSVGQSVTFTATVTGPGGTPSGSVTFRDGTTVLGTASLANGVATFATAALSAGAHTITAAYAGDTSFSASTSAPLTQQVNAVVGGVSLTVITAGRDGSFSFVSTLPGATSFTLTTSGNRASRTFTNVPPGAYTITSLGVPPGFAAQGFTCSTGTNGAGTVAFTVAAGANVTCTFSASFDEAAVRRTTQAAIRSFMQQRAEAIAQAQPETRRFHDRFTGSLFGDDGGMGGGLFYAQNPIEFTGSTTLGGTNLTGTTSLSRIMRPNEKLDFDAWVDVRSGTYHDAVDQNPLATPSFGLRSRYSGSFTLAFAGVDYRLAPSVLVGVLGQFDQVRQNASSLGTAASGTGYMIGPYVSMALTPQVFFDARAAYGMSSNVVTPAGLPQSSFSTDRQLYRAELSGLYRIGDLKMLPSISALYFAERQLAFTDALAVRIPGQHVGLGQVAVGPEFSYDVATPYGLVVPRIAARAIYNFLRDDEASAALGIVQPTGPLRARVEGGIDLQDFYGFTLGTSISYDGIGDTRYSATSGRVSLRRQF